MENHGHFDILRKKQLIILILFHENSLRSSIIKVLQIQMVDFIVKNFFIFLIHVVFKSSQMTSKKIFFSKNSESHNNRRNHIQTACPNPKLSKFSFPRLISFIFLTNFQIFQSKVKNIMLQTICCNIIRSFLFFYGAP